MHWLKIGVHETVSSRLVNALALSFLCSASCVPLEIGSTAQAAQGEGDASGRRDAQTPGEVVRQYWDHIQRGKPAKARELLTASWRERVPPKAFTPYAEELERKQQTPRDLRVHFENPNRARVELKFAQPSIRRDDGTEYVSPPQAMYLEKEKGKWRLTCPTTNVEPVEWGIEKASPTAVGDLRAILGCVQKWFEARNARDPKAEYDLLSPECRQSTSLAEIRAQVLPKNLTGELILAGTPSIAEERARMKVFCRITERGPDGSVTGDVLRLATFDFVRTPEGWRRSLPKRGG